MILQIDIRVGIEIDDDDLEGYGSLLEAARESRDEIEHAVRADEFTILDVKEVSSFEETI